MKKTVVIAFLLLFCVLVTMAFSAAVLPENSKNLSVDYTDNTPGISLPVTDGKVSGTLPDGTNFTAENFPPNTAILRICPVQPEETEVLRWVEDCLPEQVDSVVTYAVFCFDGRGKEHSNQGVKITINAPETEKSIAVYSLDSNGKPTALSSSVQDGKIIFTATGPQLYPLTVPAENPETSASNARPFLMLISLSAAFTAALLLKHKRKV